MKKENKWGKIDWETFSWFFDFKEERASQEEYLEIYKKIRDIINNNDFVKVRKSNFFSTIGVGVRNRLTFKPLRGKSLSVVENDKLIDIKSLHELIKEKVSIENQNEEEYYFGDLDLSIDFNLYFYDSKGKIIRDWIYAPLDFVLNNEVDEFYISIHNASEIWQPFAYSNSGWGSSDNLELAKLNIPILNNFLKQINEKLGIKLEPDGENNLSEENKKLIYLDSDGIKFKE